MRGSSTQLLPGDLGIRVANSARFGEEEGDVALVVATDSGCTPA